MPARLLTEEIHPRLGARLLAVVRHPVRVFAAGRIEEMSIYPVALERWGKDGQSHSIRVLPVYAAQFHPDCAFMGLLGRDVLQTCNFSYRGRDEVFTLEF